MVFTVEMAFLAFALLAVAEEKGGELFVKELDRLERCTTCHTRIADPKAAEEPQPLRAHPGQSVAWHPPERFGCTICHHGRGEATTAKTAHATVVEVMKPTLPLDDPEVRERLFLKGKLVQASCIKCHEKLLELKGAPDLTRGAQLFKTYGCSGCHAVDLPALMEKRKPGPDLTRINTKVERPWLLAWLRNPRPFRADTRMPDFLLSEEEVEAIADYLLSLAEKEIPRVAWDPLLLKPREALAGEELKRWDEVFRKGQELWKEAGCSFCHSMKEEGGRFEIGPDLGGIAEKVNRDWLFLWLKAPRSYFPEAQHPSLQASDEAIKALVHYIMEAKGFRAGVGKAGGPERPLSPLAFKRGKELVSYYGCAGCHEIKGHEGDRKIGASLEGVGSNPFKQAWIARKLTDPRSTATVTLEHPKMPDLGLTPQEIRALRVLLMGFTDEKVPEGLQARALSFAEPPGEAGRLLQDYTCLTCHRIQGKGGSVAPDLTFEGSKVRREWLVRFLRHPEAIRPLFGLIPHPRLSEGESEALADFIMAELITDKVHQFNRAEPTQEQTRRGEALFEEYGCLTCHRVEAEGGLLGPDLTHAGGRLQPGYVYALLKNPQAFDPMIVKPNLGLTDEEAMALTQYLMTLR